MVALDQGAVSGVANAGDDATEGIGEQKERATIETVGKRTSAAGAVTGSL